MYETLSLMNTRLLLWLNHALAAHQTLYGIALVVTDAGADLALLLTAAWLWFWPDRAGKAGRAGRSGRGFRGFFTDPTDPTDPTDLTDQADQTDPPQVVTRADSRARLLVLGAGGIAAYIIARLIAFELDIARPFVTYLPIRGNPGAFEGLRTFGALPSDHAALLAALPVAFRYWGRRLFVVWSALAVFLVIVRIAVGFHYPSDMLAGAAIGVVCVAAAMAVYDRSLIAQRATGTVVNAFAHPRHALVLYPVLALVGVEFAMHFSHVLWALFVIRQWFA